MTAVLSTLPLRVNLYLLIITLSLTLLSVRKKSLSFVITEKEQQVHAGSQGGNNKQYTS